MHQVNSENSKVVASEKKAYTAPKVTRHGKVEELTQGLYGDGFSCPIEVNLPQ
jgi:hypothetical protein